MKNIQRGRRMKVTKEMINLMNCIPSLLITNFNDGEEEIKSLYGLLYSIGNSCNTNVVTISRSKVTEGFGKNINGITLAIWVSQLITKNLIQRVGENINGTVYKILNLETSMQANINNQNKQEMIETRSSKIESPFDSILNELKEIRKENQELKEGMRVLNNNFKKVVNEISTVKNEISTVKNEISNLQDDNNKIKEGMRVLNNKFNVLKTKLDELEENNHSISNEISTVKNDTENTPTTSLNAIVSDETVSNEELHTQTPETRSNTLKMQNNTSSLDDDNNTNKSIQTNVENVSDNTVTSTKLELTESMVESIINNEMAEDDLIKLSFDDLDSINTLLVKYNIFNKHITKAIELKRKKALEALEKEKETQETIEKGSTNAGNTPTISSNVPNDDIHSDELNAMREQAKADSGCFTKLGKYNSLLLQRKNNLMDAKKNFDWIDKELLRTFNEDTIYPVIGKTLLPVRPKEERVKAIYKLNLDEIENEIKYREINDMEEDDNLDIRREQLIKMQEFHMNVPEVEESNYSLPF